MFSKATYLFGCNSYCKVFLTAQFNKSRAILGTGPSDTGEGLNGFCFTLCSFQVSSALQKCHIRDVNLDSPTANRGSLLSTGNLLSVHWNINDFSQLTHLLSAFSGVVLRTGGKETEQDLEGLGKPLRRVTANCSAHCSWQQVSQKENVRQTSIATAAVSKQKKATCVHWPPNGSLF